MDNIITQYENNDPNGRIEVLTKNSNCKLGHVFNDGKNSCHKSSHFL
jgi:peptide methionine sulfoxide reductase MsrB